MKHIIFIFFILIFWHQSSFCSNKEFYSLNTRKYTIKEAIKTQPLDSLVLIKSFEGLSLQAIRDAYQNTDAKVDSIILAEERSGQFFSRYRLFTIQLYSDARQSPQKAMSYLFPIFIVLFIIYLIVFGVKTFLIWPRIGQKIELDAE